MPYRAWDFIKRIFTSCGKVRARKPSNQKFFHGPVIEPLEERRLMAIRVWSGLGGDANWNTPANWVGSTAPSPDDALVFDSTGQQSTTVNNFANNTRFRSITFASGGYSITGNPFTLLEGVVNNGTSTVADTISATITLGQNQSFVVSNTGAALVLSNINTGSLLNATFDGLGTISASGSISGGGGITKNGLGTLVLSGSNSYDGLTQVNLGTVSLRRSNALGTVNGYTVVNPGAAVQVDTNNTFSEPITLNGSGVGTSSTGALRNTANNATWLGEVQLLGNAAIGADAGTSLYFGGAVGALGTGFTKVGSGTVGFFGSTPNNITGTVFVSQGLLDLQKFDGANNVGVRALSGNLVIGDSTQAAGTATVRAYWDNQLASVDVNGVNAVGVTVNGSGQLLLDGANVTTGYLLLTRSATTAGSVTNNSFGSLYVRGNVVVQSLPGSSDTTPAASIGTSNLFFGPDFGNGVAATANAGLVTASHQFIVADSQMPGTADDLVVSAAIGGFNNVGWVKSGAGTLDLTSSFSTSPVANTVVLAAGVLGIGNNNALSSSQTLVVQGGELQAIGGARQISSRIALDGNMAVRGSNNLTFTNTVVLSGGTINNVTRTINVEAAGQVTTFNQGLSEDLFGNVSLIKAGRGELNLRGANNISGTVTLATDGGTVRLSGSGTLVDTPSITLNQGTQLLLDNSTTALSNRINDNATITLNGGEFGLIGSNGVANAIEQVGPVVLSPNSSSTISSSNVGSGSTALVMATLTRSTVTPGTINFVGSGAPLSAVGNNSILVENNLPTVAGVASVLNTSAANGIISGAIMQNVGAIDFASIAGGNALGFAIVPLPASAYTTDLTQATATSNVKLISNTTLPGSITVNALLLSGSGINLSGSGQLTVNTGTIVNNGVGNQISTSWLSLPSTDNMLHVNTGNLSVSSAIVGASANLTKAGVGQLTLQGNNEYTGITYINQGVLNIQNSAALGYANAGAAAAGTIVYPGASLEMQDGTAGPVQINLELLTLIGNGFNDQGALRNISGNNSWAGDVSLSGTFFDLYRTFDSSAVYTTNTATTIRSDVGRLTLSGIISGASDLIKTGLGTVEFGGVSANTVATPLRIASGTLEFNKPTAINAWAGNQIIVGDNVSSTSATLRLVADHQIPDTTPVVVGASGIFDLNNRSDIIGGLSLAGGLASASVVNTGTGVLTIPTGIAVLSRGNVATSVATINGTLSLQAATANPVAAPAAVTVTIDVQNISGDSGPDLNINGTIMDGSRNSNALIKTGSGTLRFSGSSANTYSGTTSVNEGALELNKTPGVNALTGALNIGDGFGGPQADVVRWLQSDQISDYQAFITVSASGWMNLNGQNETIGSPTGVTLSVTGGVVDTGVGTLSLGAQLSASSGELLLAGASGSPARITGNLALGAGTRFVQVQTNASASTNPFDAEISANITGPSNATLRFLDVGRVLFSGNSNTFAGDVINYTGTTIYVAGYSSLGTGTIQTGSTSVGAWNGPLTLTNNILIGGAGALTVPLTNNVTFAGPVNVALDSFINPASAFTLNVPQLATVTFAGGLGESLTANTTWTKNGAGTVVLSSRNTLSGALVFNAGTLWVQGNGTLINTPSITLGLGATLHLDNRQVNLDNRIADAAAITLNSATLLFEGMPGNATLAGVTSTETVGAIAFNTVALVGAGPVSDAIIVRTSGTTGSGAILTAASLTRGTTSFINLVGEGQALGSANSNVRLRVTAAIAGTTNNVIPYAILRGPNGAIDFAQHTSATLGISPAPFVTSMAAATSPTMNVKLSSNDSVVGAQSINSLIFTGSGITLFGTAGTILTVGPSVGVGGMIYNPTGANNTIGGASIGAFTPLNFVTDSLSRLTVNSDIVTSASVGGVLNKQLTGTLVLNGANSNYTTAMNLNSGSLVVSTSNALGSAVGGTFINAGAELDVIGSVTPGAVNIVEPFPLVAGSGTGGSGAIRFLDALPGSAESAILSGAITIGATTDTWMSVDTGGANADRLTLRGVVSGGAATFALNKVGQGILEFGGSANNTYTSPTRVSQGTLRLSPVSGVAIPNASALFVGDDVGGQDADVLESNASEAIANGGAGNPITITSSGRWNFLGNFNEQQTSPITLLGSPIGRANISTSTGTLTLGFAAGQSITVSTVASTLGNRNSSTIAGQVNLNIGGSAVPASWTINDTIAVEELAVTATIADGGSTNSWVKLGAGRMALFGTNTMAAPVNINAGEIVAYNTSALGSTVGATNIAPIGQLILGIPNVAFPTETLNLGGVGSNGAGALRLNPTVASATVQWSGALNFTSAGSIGVESGHSLEHTGIMSGNVAVSKVLPGTLILGGSNSNTFTGGFNLLDGTVALRKTASAIAIPGSLTIGDDFGGTSADLVLFLADNQITPSSAITINSTGYLNQNTFAQSYGQSGTTPTITLKYGPTSSAQFGGLGNTVTLAGPLNMSVGPATPVAGGVFNTYRSPAAAITANLNLGSSTMAFNVQDDTFIVSELSVGGTLTSTTGGGWIKNTGLGAMQIGSSNSQTMFGNATLSAGVLDIANNGALGPNPLLVSGSSFLRASSAQTINTPINLTAASLTFAGRGNITLTGSLIFNGTAAQSVASSLNSANTLSFSGGTLLQPAGNNLIAITNNTLNNQVRFPVAISQVPSATTLLTKAGVGTVVLSAPNTFTGSAQVLSGVLAISNSNALGSATVVTVNGTGTLSLSGGLSVAGTRLDLAGLGFGNHGNVRVSDSSNNTWTGDLRVFPNIIAMMTPVSTGGSLNFSGLVASGAGSTLIKSGFGTVQYSGSTGNNTFSGTTNVAQGTLLLNKQGFVALAGPLVVGDGGGANNSDVVTVQQPGQLGTGFALTVGASGLLQLQPGVSETVASMLLYNDDLMSADVVMIGSSSITITTGGISAGPSNISVTSGVGPAASISGGAVRFTASAATRSFSILDSTVSNPNDDLVVNSTVSSLSGSFSANKLGTGTLVLTSQVDVINWINLAGTTVLQNTGIMPNLFLLTASAGSFVIDQPSTVAPLGFGPGILLGGGEFRYNGSSGASVASFGSLLVTRSNSPSRFTSIVAPGGSNQISFGAINFDSLTSSPLLTGSNPGIVLMDGGSNPIGASTTNNVLFFGVFVNTTLGQVNQVLPSFLLVNSESAGGLDFAANRFDSDFGLQRIVPATTVLASSPTDLLTSSLPIKIVQPGVYDLNAGNYNINSLMIATSGVTLLDFTSLNIATGWLVNTGDNNLIQGPQSPASLAGNISLSSAQPGVGPSYLYAPSGTLTVSAPIISASNNGVAKYGAGRVNLTGNNTFSGNFTIGEGILGAGSNNALGSTLSQTIQTLNFISITGGSFTIGFNGATAGPFGASQPPSVIAAQLEASLNTLSTVAGVNGYISATGAGNSVTLSFYNSFNGLSVAPVVVTPTNTGGFIQVVATTPGTVLSAGSTTFVQSGATLNVYNYATIINENLTLNGTGYNSQGSTLGGIGALRAEGTTGYLTVNSGQVAAVSGATIVTPSSTDYFTLNGRFSNSTSFRKSGSGSLELTGSFANVPLTGVAFVDQGTLVLNKFGSVPIGAVVIGDHDSTGGLDKVLLKGSDQIAAGSIATINRSGVLDINSNTVTLSTLNMTGGSLIDSSQSTVAHSLNVTQLNLRSSSIDFGTGAGVITLTNVGSVNVAAGTTTRINATVVVPATGNTARQFIVEDGPNVIDLEFNAPINATNAAAKLGAGVMLINSPSSFGYINEQQLINLTGLINYQFTYTNQSGTATSPDVLNSGSDIFAITSAIGKIPAIGSNNVSVSSTSTLGIYNVTYLNALAGQNVSPLSFFDNQLLVNCVASTVVDGGNGLMLAQGVLAFGVDNPIGTSGLTMLNNTTLWSYGGNHSSAMQLGLGAQTATSSTVNIGGRRDYGGANSLFLSGPTTLLSATGSILVADPLASVTLAGSISELALNSSIVKTGIGELILSGNNAYTGITSVSQGLLTVASNNALGSSGNPKQILTIPFADAGTSSVFRLTYNNNAYTTTNIGFVNTSPSELQVTAATMEAALNNLPVFASVGPIRVTSATTNAQSDGVFTIEFLGGFLRAPASGLSMDPTSPVPIQTITTALVGATTSWTQVSGGAALALSGGVTVMDSIIAGGRGWNSGPTSRGGLTPLGDSQGAVLSIAGNNTILGLFDVRAAAAASDTIFIGANADSRLNLATQITGTINTGVSNAAAFANSLVEVGAGTVAFTAQGNNLLNGNNYAFGSMLEFNKSINPATPVLALNGPLVIGNNTSTYTSVVKLDGANQILLGTTTNVTLSANGQLNLNVATDAFNTITGQLGPNRSSSILIGSSSQLLLNGNLTVNALMGATTQSTMQISGGGSIVSSANRTFTINDGPAANDLIFSAAYGNFGTSAAGISTTGLGRIVLSGNSTYTGQTTVAQGILSVQSNNALGNVIAANSNTVVLTGASLELQGGVTINESLQLSGLGFASSGALHSVGAGTNAIAPGAFNSPAIDLRMAAVTATPDIIQFNSDVGSYLNLRVPISATNTLGAATGNGLIKIGGGTIAYASSNANSYSGATVVSEGTLLVAATNNNTSILGNMTIGNGRINGPSALVSVDNTKLIGAVAVTVLNNGSFVTNPDKPQPIRSGLTALNFGVGPVSSGNVSGPTNPSMALDFGGNVSTFIAAGVTSAAPPAMWTGNISGNGAVIFNTNEGPAGVELTVTGAIDGTTVTKNGLGTLILAGTNTYSGLTTINAGTVVVTSGNVLGDPASGTTVAAGATLAFSSAGTLNYSQAEAITLLGGSGAGSIGVNEIQTLNVSGVATQMQLIFDGQTTAPFDLTQATANQLQTALQALSNVGSNNVLVFGPVGGPFAVTFVNGLGARDVPALVATTVGGGSVTVATTTNGVQRSLVLDPHSGALEFLAGNTDFLGTITASADTTIGVTSGNATVSGTANFNSPNFYIRGAGNLTFSQAVGGNSLSKGLDSNDSGVLTLASLSNSYSGSTTINGGKVSAAASENLGLGNNIIFNGGTLQATGSFSNGRGMTSGPLGANIEVLSGVTLTQGAIITGPGSLTKLGAGTLLLQNTGNNYSGGNVLNEGTLTLNPGVSLGATAGTLTINGSPGGSVLNLNSSQTISGLLGSNLAGTSAINLLGTAANTLTINQAFNSSFDGTITGASGSLVKLGVGTLTLNGNNTYSLGTSILGGALSVSSNNNLGGLAGTVIMNNGATLQVTGNLLTSNRQFILNATNGGQFDIVSPATLNLTGQVSGGGSLTKIGSGTLVLNSVSNSYTGGTTVLNGVLSVSQDANLGATFAGVTLSGGTLQASNSFPSSRTITLGTAGGTIDVVVSSTLTLNGPLQGLGSLTVSNNGTLILNNTTSSYSGGTVFAGGTTQISSDANLGDSNGSLVFSGGVLRSTASLTSSRAALIQSNALATFDVSSGTTFAFNGDLTGSGGILKIGGGELVLGGNNTYSGGSTINVGTLTIDQDQRLGVATSGVTLNSGATTATLRTTSSFGTTRTFTLGSGGGAFSPDSGTVFTSNGTIVGAGQLSVTGSGTLLLANNNAYQGGTLLKNGTLSASFDSQLGQPSTAVTLQGGNLFANGSFNLLRPVALVSPGGGLNAGTGVTFTINGRITGNTGQLSANGPGTLILTDITNSYVAGTVLNGGTVVVSADSQLGDTNGGLTFNGGTLQIANTMSTPRTIVVNSSGGFIDVLSGISYTTARSVSGVGTLTKNGSGTLTYSSANSQFGGTTVNAGTLIVNSGATLGATSATLTVNSASGTTNVNLNGAATVGGLAGTLTGGTAQINLSGASALTVNQIVDTAFGGTIVGSGQLIKQGVGTLSLTGTNNYSGGTQILGGAVAITSDGALGSTTGNVTLNGGTLRVTADVDTPRNISLGASGGTIDVTGTSSFTEAGNITGIGGLTKVGSGTLLLNGTANAYSGGTTISAGTVTVANPTGLGATNGRLTVSSVAGATILNLSNNTIVGNFSGTVNGGSATINLNNNAVLSINQTAAATFNGSIAGSGGLVKAGSSALALLSANSYSGATNITAGTLDIRNPLGLGYGDGSTASGTVLASNATLLIQGGINIANEALTLAGVGSGSGNLFSSNGNNLFGGPITLSGTAASIGIASNSTLVMSGNFEGSLAGSQALTLNAAGAATLSGSIGGNVPLGAVTIANNASNVTLGNLTAASLVQANGLGLTTINGSVRTTGTVGISLATNSLNIGGSITTNTTGPVTLSTANNGTLTLASTITSGGAFTQNGNSPIALSGSITTNNANVTFNSTSAITLAGSTQIATNSGTGPGNITFTSPVNATAAGVQALTLTAGAGSITTNSLGTSTLLGPILINSANNLTLGNLSASSLIETVGTGTTTLSGVNIGGVLNLSAGALLANSSITTAGNVTLRAAGAVTLNGSINASIGTITIAANQGGSGVSGFNQNSGTITTLNNGTSAVSITTNTSSGGTGNAVLNNITVGDGGTISVNAWGGSINQNSGTLLDDGSGNLVLLTSGATSAVGQSIVLGAITSRTGSLTANAGSGGLFVIESDNLNVGSASSAGLIHLVTGGLISLNGNIRGTTVAMATPVGVVQSAGNIVATNLGLVGVGGFTFNNSTNDVGTLAASFGPGQLSYIDTNNLTVGTVTTPNGNISGIRTGNASNNGGRVTLQAGGTLSVNQLISSSSGLGGVTFTSGSVSLAVTPAPGAGNISLFGNPLAGTGAPLVTLSASALSYTEGQGALSVDNAALLADSTNTLASLSIAITGNFVLGQDSLTYSNTASIRGSFNSTTGVLTLTGAATIFGYQTALRSVGYANSSPNPITSPRTISVVADDGRYTNDPAFRTINLTAVNSAPVVTASGSTTNYTESSAPAAIDPNLQLNDVDNITLSSATISILGNFSAGQDVLSFVNQSGIVGNYVASTGVLTLSGTASLANYSAALNSVAYSNSSRSPFTSPRTIGFSVNDGAATSSVTSKTVTITPVNDPPIITASAGVTNYTEKASAQVIDANFNLFDFDSLTLSSATITITNAPTTGEDLLSFTPIGNITGNFNALTNALSLSGVDSQANWITALRSVTYQNSNTINPSGTTRDIAFQVNDGGAAPNTSLVTNKSVSITLVNDPPVITLTAGSATFTEKAGPIAVDPTLQLNDFDSTNLVGATIVISGNSLASTGEDVLSFTPSGGITGLFNPASSTLTLNGNASINQWQTVLRSITFADTSVTPSALPRTIQYVLNDGNAQNNLSLTTTRQVDVIPVNDVPVVTVATSPLTYVEQSGPLTLDPTLTLADVDGGPFGASIAGALISISSGYCTGQDILSFNNQSGIIGNFDASTGTLTLTGVQSYSAYISALRSITYSNASDFPSSAARNLSFSVTDGTAGAAGYSIVQGRSLQIQQINDQPTISTQTSQSAAAGSAKRFSSATFNPIII